MTSESKLRDFGRLICSVGAGATMSREEACAAYSQVILNKQPELQQGAFLAAHFMRGPTTEELSGVWDALDTYDTAKISTTLQGPVCDIVGTGSDALKTVNCSTPAALIAAACGLPVAKKGARLVTGVSGATDILEILGIDICAPLGRAETCLETYRICYLPGESFLRSGWSRLITHMRFTSVFNIIGPLTRPCPQTDSIVVGAYGAGVCRQLIAVLKEVGMQSALSPYGMVDGKEQKLGMDEFSPAGPTMVVELRNGTIQQYSVGPEDFGIRMTAFSSIASGATAQENAQTVLDVLRGRYDSAAADFFCMNAAAALYISGTARTYRQGMDMARQALATGKAYEKFKQLHEIQGTTR